MSIQRVAFKMKLRNPSLMKEYHKRHNEIWPELEVLIRESGVSDYSIFCDEKTGDLFAVQKVSGNEGSQDLGTNPVVQKWWSYMADIMETEPDNAPVSLPLTEVFHLD